MRLVRRPAAGAQAREEVGLDACGHGGAGGRSGVVGHEAQPVLAGAEGQAAEHRDGAVAVTAQGAERPVTCGNAGRQRGRQACDVPAVPASAFRRSPSRWTRAAIWRRPPHARASRC